MTLVYCFFLFLYGCTWGSFLMVIGARIPLQQSIVFSRSRCPHCRNQLSPSELIPLLSYLIQKGRCRQCKRSISLFYPLMEWVTGLLFIFSFWYARSDVETTLVLFLLCSFGLVFTVTDLTYRILPNRIMFSFFILVYLLNAFLRSSNFYAYALTGLGFFSFFYVFYLAFPNGIGGGDVKYYAIIGFLLGYQASLFAVILACAFASSTFLLLRIYKNIPKNTPIPFAPFIFIGAFLSYILTPLLF